MSLESMNDNFTDIHTHLIAGIDDGANNLAESADMLCMAYEEGIRQIFLTPHFGLRNPDFSKEEALARLEGLKKIAECNCPGMKFYMGNELYWSEGIIDSLKNGEAFTMADTSYVLVEFDVDESFENIEDAVEKLTWNKYRPIIAHAERYWCLFGNPYLVSRLIERGAYIQVNTRSIVSYGRKKRFLPSKSSRQKRNEQVLEMIKNRQVHFIATDMHDPLSRTPVFARPVEVLREIIGDEAAKEIVHANIEKLLKDESI